MGTKQSKRILSMFLALVLTISLIPAAFAADGDGSTNTITTSDGGTVTLTLNGSSEASLNTPIRWAAGITVKDKDGNLAQSGYTVVYDWDRVEGVEKEEISSDASMNSVYLTGREEGTYIFKVTAKVTSADGAFADVQLYVNKPLTITASAVSSVTLNRQSLTLDVGGAETLQATVNPDGGHDVTWLSSDSSVATVTDGHVTALSPGKATITATSVKDGTKKAECQVLVKGIVIKNPGDKGERVSSVDMYEGDSRNFVVQLFGIANDAAMVTWSSNHSEIAHPDASSNGQNASIYAGQSGTARITVRVAGYTGFVAYLDVNVTANPKTTIVVNNISRAAPLNFGTIRSQLVSAANGDLASLSNLVAPTSGGIIYYDWHSDDEQGRAIGTSESFVATELDKLTFVPAAGSGGTVDIPYTVRTSEGRTINGTIEVHLKTTSQEISYSTINRTPVHFIGSDFNRISQSLSSVPVGKVVFSVPDKSRGVLYLGYNSESSYEAVIQNDVEYKASDLDRITFVPAAGFRGSVSIPFVLYNTTGSRFTGNKVTIEVSQSSAEGPVYNVGPGETATLRLSDFRSYLSAMGGGNLSHVHFKSLPSSSQGTLYYNYRSGSGTPVTTDANYYSGRQPYLDQVTFVSASGFDGTVSIPFEAVDTQGTRVSGDLVVNVTVQGSGDVHYTVGPGQSVTFGQQNFNNLCQQLTGRSLNYVQFTSLPASSRGSLTYNRLPVSTNDRYYVTSNNRRSLNNVVFTAASSYTGMVSIPFTGEAVSGERFSGIVSIEVRTGRSDLSYTITAGQTLTFNAADFDNYAREVTGYSLNYVRFALPSSNRGILYYDYWNTSNHEKTRVSASNQYYYGRSNYLDRVTFVPNVTFTGDVAISYTGYTNNGQQYNGTVNIRVNLAQATGIVQYATEYDTVYFQAADFARVAPGALSYINVTNPPAASTGRLHSGNLGTSTSTSYHYSGSPAINSLNFTPRAGYTGTVSIPYTGVLTNGESYGGTVEITVTSRSNSVYFSDVGVGSYSWAASAVDYLYSNQIVSGVGGTRYGPSRAIKRGDFALMLCKAFDLNSSYVGSGFSDVPSTAYYADAVGTLKDLGVVSGDGRRFRPDDSVTRQDAMVMLQKAMKSAGWTLYDGGASSLSTFLDGGRVSPYAQGAVSCMVQMGILSGDSRGNLNPRGTLNRAEMAVVLHKAMTY